MAFTPLNALHAFIAVAGRRSYAAAARDLGITTSALSQSVRLLEERLGATLLTRTSRNVALTDAGQRLLERAGPAVGEALEALKAVNAPPGQVTGRVRLSVPSLAVPLVLARVVPRFVERYPGVELEVRVEDHFVDVVGEGLDGGMRVADAIDRDMVQVRLCGPFRVLVAGAPSYLERRGTPLEPEDLLRHECICSRLPSSQDPWPWQLERDDRAVRVPVRGPVTTNDFHLTRTVAAAGVGLLYAPEPMIADELSSGALRVVLAKYALTLAGLFLYFPSRAHVSPAFRAFVDVARAASAPE